jgi:hypothetical protein
MTFISRKSLNSKAITVVSKTLARFKSVTLVTRNFLYAFTRPCMAIMPNGYSEARRILDVGSGKNVWVWYNTQEENVIPMPYQLPIFWLELAFPIFNNEHTAHSSKPYYLLPQKVYRFHYVLLNRLTPEALSGTLEVRSAVVNTTVKKALKSANLHVLHEELLNRILVKENLYLVPIKPEILSIRTDCVMRYM